MNVRAAEGGPPPWLFCVAAAPHVGGGHVSRCMVLGAEILAHAPIVFVLEGGGEAWRPELERRAFEVQASFDRGRRWAGSLMDGYEFTEDYVERVRSAARPLVILADDEAPRPLADLVVCPIADARAGSAPRTLAGPRYALVGRNFRQSSLRSIADAVRHVVVSCGRHDAGNGTGLFLAALVRLESHGFLPVVTVVMGRGSPNLDEIRAQVTQRSPRWRIVIDTNEMDVFLRDADLAVGSGGVGLTERLASGIPSITVTVAENQKRWTSIAASLGATVDAGSIEQVTPDSLANEIGTLVRSASARVAQSRRAVSLIDGRGPERVAEAMLSASSRFHGAGAEEQA